MTKQQYEAATNHQSRKFPKFVYREIEKPMTLNKTILQAYNYFLVKSSSKTNYLFKLFTHSKPKSRSQAVCFPHPKKQQQKKKRQHRKRN